MNLPVIARVRQSDLRRHHGSRRRVIHRRHHDSRLHLRRLGSRRTA